MPNSVAFTKAEQLASLNKSHSEADVRKRVDGLLEAVLDIKTEQGHPKTELEHPTSSGPCDIYVPRIKLIVETKRVGKADPAEWHDRENGVTIKQQLEGYVKAQREEENAIADLFQTEEEKDLHWVGILTDGKVFRIYNYRGQGKFSAPAKPVACIEYKDAGQLLADLTPHITRKPVGKEWAPTDTITLFRQYPDKIDKIYETLGTTDRAHTQTKLKLWLDMMRASGMAPDNEKTQIALFLRHTLLVVISRGVAETLNNAKQRPNINTIAANGFAAWLLANPQGKKLVEEIAATIHRYEWRMRTGDVLRNLYQNLIDVRHRKIFGEYYTPDWLASMLVDEICDEAWMTASVKKAIAAKKSGKPLTKSGVLDPSCGSGTFLYWAARRIYYSPALTKSKMEDADKAEIALSLVWGLDIHPVAVELAKATLLRAVPVTPRTGSAAVQVFQGDSLDADNNLSGDNTGSQQVMMRESSAIQITSPRGIQISIPDELVFGDDPKLAIQQFVQSARDKKSLPTKVADAVGYGNRKNLQTAHKKMTQVIDNEGNSIWSWFILNTAAAFVLHNRRVDRIVANPPWVRYNEIQHKHRKEVIRQLAEKYDIWTGGKNATGFDIAQLFIRICRGHYMAEPIKNPAAWVVNAAAIKGGNWEKFREWHKKHRKQIIDFSNLKRPPFTGANSCVLVEHHRCATATGTTRAIVLAKTRDRKKPVNSTMEPKPAMALIEFERGAMVSPSRESAYANKQIRQGATLVPRNMVLLDNVSTKNGRSQVTTMKPGKMAKAPWKDCGTISGDIPARWVRQVYFSWDLFPFYLSPDPTRVIVPVTGKGQLDLQAREKEMMWKKLDDVYRNHCGMGGTTPKTLMNRVNFQNSLASQLTVGRHRVLYNTSGSILRAAHATSADTLIDSGLYSLKVATDKEALYLTAILNAQYLQQAFCDARKSDRHFHKHIWRHVPIPKFKATDKIHAALAKAASAAEKESAKLASQMDLKTMGQIAASKKIRDRLEEKGIAETIDQLTAKLLPDYAK